MYRHSLLSKSKVVCLLKVLYHKDMFHVFVFYHVYFILVKGCVDPRGSLDVVETFTVIC